MKRILALVLSLVFVFCLCACGGKKEKDDTVVDIEYYVNAGQIPESEFKLGENPETIKKALETKEKEAEKNGEHYFFTVEEGENNALIRTGDYEYYYKKAAPDKGIAFMVSYSDVFGFKQGSVIVEVKKALEDYKVTEEKVDYDGMGFFYMGNADTTTVLKVPFENNTVMFYFEDNVLCATVIYSNENWS